MGSMAWEREMSTLPKLHSEYYSIFTLLFPSLFTSVYAKENVLIINELHHPLV